MPYVIHVREAASDAFDRLVDLGALDVEIAGRKVSALMPDGVAPARVAHALGIGEYSTTPAAGRDDGSVWTLRPRAVRIGRIHIVPAGSDGDAGTVRLVDGAVFGTGLHPTTALCLEWLDEIVMTDAPEAMLDVGTGSGVLALAALQLGVRRAVAVDVDDAAIRVAADNARLNLVSDRLQLAFGGPDIVTGVFPLVVANVLPAALVEMASVLVQRVAHHGWLLLSGIPRALDDDVARAYRRLGMHHASMRARREWTALLLQASW